MKFKLPDTLIIVSTILLIFVILTWIIPAGEFDRDVVNGREVLVPGSYHEIEPAPQGFFDFLKAPIKGFISAAQIVGFVLLVGGAFSVINKTDAINAGLKKIIDFTRQYPKMKKVMVAFLIVLFSLAGATFGMSEEVLVFVLITIPLGLSLGYDSLVGIYIPFVGAGAGFAGAFSNPFTIGIAQGIAELPPFSGWEYRLLVWACFTTIAVLFMLWYLTRLDKDPKRSPVFRIDQKRDTEDLTMPSHNFDNKKLFVVVIFIAGLIGLVVGVSQWDWYINEISGLFILISIVAAFMGRLSPNTYAQAFVDGARDMMTAALVIAFSKGILIVATDGKIIDTVLFSLSGLAEGSSKILSVELMFFVQSAINLFLPSGSGQAALTMPIMAPLSDLLGVSRQTAVLAFQFGDGLSNLIIPTSGVTMGVLSIAGIPYQVWIKWMAPLMVIFFLLAMALLVPPVILGWGPF
jgi:uncharacterized ion transporter superfamily protein YfcC